MSDRELLEAAAKAAGIEQPTGQDGYVAQGGTFVFYLDCEGKTCRTWNPLENDGDALRLAVKLKLKVYQGEFVAVVQFRMAHNYIAEEYERNGMDANEATRRAITRAAASIGSGKESAS